MSGFKDHFSSHAADYAAFRPRWPPELFSWLSGQVYSRDLAWDCATGNGQAARALAAHFDRLIRQAAIAPHEAAAAVGEMRAAPGP